VSTPFELKPEDSSEIISNIVSVENRLLDAASKKQPRRPSLYIGKTESAVLFEGCCARECRTILVSTLRHAAPQFSKREINFVPVSSFPTIHNGVIEDTTGGVTCM
jgi:hypothetical protein